MKKLVLAAAVLLGGIAASQAGVSVNIGFGHPFPRPVIISRPAPVVVAPACRAPVVVAPPVCRDQYVQPVIMPRYGYQYPRYGYNSHPGYHRDWDRHDRGHDHRNDHRGDHRNDHRDDRGHDRGGWGSHRR